MILILILQTSTEMEIRRLMPLHLFIVVMELSGEVLIAYPETIVRRASGVISGS